MEARGDEPPAGTVRITWQLRGLFCPEREREFRELCVEKLPAIRVVNIDMPHSEATLEFDPAAAFGPPFKNAKPEALLHVLNGKLQQASHSTFSAHPRRTTPLEKLVWIEIPFEGLDCQGCAYGVYRILVELKGVEHAAVDIRTGLACDWQADGYRLPTEAEWEAAARGGLLGKRFPWGDTISHDRANYIAGPREGYEESQTAGHHPQFALVGAAGTSRVKTFPPNGYGLYDMAGNVSQWCWDWFGNYPEKPSPNPKGPAQGSLRILRGGHWNNAAVRATCGFRVTGFPSLASTNVGFRVARRQITGAEGRSSSDAGAGN